MHQGPRRNSVPFAECPLPITDDEQILLGHGSGGKLTSRLVEQIFLPAFRNPALECARRSGNPHRSASARIAFTTDSYVITPIFFPGGDIGELAVNGTINDLAVGGAEAALSLAGVHSRRRLADFRSQAHRRIRQVRRRKRRRSYRYRRHQGGRPRQRRQDFYQYVWHWRGPAGNQSIVAQRARPATRFCFPARSAITESRFSRPARDSSSRASMQKRHRRAARPGGRSA